MVKRSLLALSVVGAMGLMGASAQALTIADLTAPGATPIVQGDKTYSNFTYLSSDVAAGSVTVDILGGADGTSGTPGLRFRASWNTMPAGIVDSVISYDVTVNSTTSAIGGVGLTFDGAGVGGGVASVGEQITDLANPGHVYNISVLDNGTGTLTNKATDSVTLAPSTTHVHVVKDISVTPVLTATGSAATISFVDNTFTPTGGVVPPVGGVPEPASLTLIPLALVGLGLRKRLAR